MKIDIKGAIVTNDDKWIYDWLDMDAVCPRDVLRAIENANGDKLEIYINSPGGDIFAGSEIYAALQAYTGEVRIHVVGSACSAASVIACAGRSDMVRTGLFMYHNVSGGFKGDYHAMDKGSEILQTANRAIAAAYREKTGKTEKDLLQAMDAETWITAEEAVALGFIDEIAENKNLRLAASAPGVLPAAVLGKVRNIANNPQSKENADVLKARHKLLNLKVEVKP